MYGLCWPCESGLCCILQHGTTKLKYIFFLKDQVCDTFLTRLLSSICNHFPFLFEWFVVPKIEILIAKSRAIVKTWYWFLFATFDAFYVTIIYVNQLKCSYKNVSNCHSKTSRTKRNNGCLIKFLYFHCGLSVSPYYYFCLV